MKKFLVGLFDGSLIDRRFRVVQAEDAPSALVEFGRRYGVRQEDFLSGIRRVDQAGFAEEFWEVDAQAFKALPPAWQSGAVRAFEANVCSALGDEKAELYVLLCREARENGTQRLDSGRIPPPMLLAMWMHGYATDVEVVDLEEIEQNELPI